MEKFEELKAKCDELGIKYHHKAGVKKLTELLEAHEVAPEASPAVVVASAEEEATEVVVEVKETERGVELRAQPMKVSDAANITVKDGKGSQSLVMSAGEKNGGYIKLRMGTLEHLCTKEFCGSRSTTVEVTQLVVALFYIPNLFYAIKGKKKDGKKR